MSYVKKYGPAVGLFVGGVAVGALTVVGTKVKNLILGPATPRLGE